MELCGASEDPDKFCSYSTRQQVSVQDRWLGIINCSLQTAMVCYIVFGIFIYNKGYLEYEQSRGGIATHVRGDLLVVSSGKSATRYFSAEDITVPGLENGNVFVTTRQIVTRQRRGVCEDKSMKCSKNSDCHQEVDGKCGDNGFCMENSWCNVEEPEIYELDVRDLSIWVKSSIQFQGFAPGKVWSTEFEHPYPEAGYNLFTVQELLMKIQPNPVRFEEIGKLGAAIEVQFVWSCNVDKSDCEPEVVARRLDNLFDTEQFGYNFNHAEYISDDERLLNQNYGVRIFLRTVGSGYRTSIVKLIMRASTAGSLLSIAPIIADLLMLQVFSLKKKYFARKYELSPDFSDYMERLNAKKEAEQALPHMLAEDDRGALEREADWQRRLHEHD